jgi:hypothetical protein
MGDECPSGKIAYASPQDAWVAVNRIRRRSSKSLTGDTNRRKPQRPHKCDDCGLWHTTSNPGKKPADRK